MVKSVKSFDFYVRHYKRLIKLMRGEWEEFLLPLVESAAQNRLIIDKIHGELMNGGELMTMSSGSMGQNKVEVSPLLGQLDKYQKTQILFYKAMGLSYDSSPTKIAGNRSGKLGDDDPMAGYISAIGGI